LVSDHNNIMHAWMHTCNVFNALQYFFVAVSMGLAYIRSWIVAG
jgi:hypothetical protein